MLSTEEATASITNKSDGFVDLHHGNGLGLTDPLLLAIAADLGLNLSSQHPLLRPNMDFVQEVAKLPIDFASVPSGTDVQGMRRWIKEVYLDPVLIEARNKCNFNRRRPQQKVNKTIVSVKSSDGSGETFELWIYQTDDKPPARGKPALMMIHGGGWIHGTPLCDEVFAETLASELDIVTVGIDYRLAPEYPFPTPLNDCADALKWVLQHADTHNIDTSRIGLWGASAGANLAAALAVKYSQEKDTQFAGLSVNLVSLVVPVAGHPKAFSRFSKNRKFPKSDNEALFEEESPPSEHVIAGAEKLLGMYIGEHGDPFDPLISPILANPTPAHPRTHITVAACDILRDQGLAYGQFLRSGGVQATDEVLPGVPHAFTYSMNTPLVERWVEDERDRFAQAFALDEIKTESSFPEILLGSFLSALCRPSGEMTAVNQDAIEVFPKSLLTACLGDAALVRCTSKENPIQCYLRSHASDIEVQRSRTISNLIEEAARMFSTFSVTDFQPAGRVPRGRACDACRRMKIKCRIPRQTNGVNGRQGGASAPGPCNSCQQARVKCTFRDKAAKRGRPSKLDLHDTSKGGDKSLPQFAPTPFSILTADDTLEGEGEEGSPLFRQRYMSEDTEMLASHGSGSYGGEFESPSIVDPAAAPRDDNLTSEHGRQFQTKLVADAWDTINAYYDDGYLVFPIVPYSELASRLVTEQDWLSQPSLRTLVLSLRLLLASGRYRMDSRDSTVLRDLILQVETSRLGYDYADPATLDEVACSLFLFTAYNVLNVHTRAFLYLDEAISLFNEAALLYEEDNPRVLRIEKVIFNTEAASQLYASKTRTRRARRPNINIDDYIPCLDGFAQDTETEAIAARLLTRLTQTYLAQDSDVLAETEMDSLTLELHSRHSYLRIQEADVIVTQQWQLSSKLVTDRQYVSIANKRPIIFSLGVQVMSWVCLLREGELRVVGLGKLAELALNICFLTGGMRCQDILRGLAGAVLREDHEQHYAPRLIGMMAEVSPSIPTMPSLEGPVALSGHLALPAPQPATSDAGIHDYSLGHLVAGVSESAALGDESLFQGLEGMGDLELVGLDWLGALAEVQ